MQYHKAALLGHERAQKAQMKLFDYTGFAFLTYTVKQVNSNFEPVGEEMLAGKAIKENEAILFICDKDGYAKAQSKPMPVHKCEELWQKMVADGILEFTGRIKAIA